MPMRLDRAIDSFLAYARIEQGLARTTLDTWGSLLRQYDRHVGPHADLSEYNLLRLKAYQYHLSQQRHLRPRSIKSAFAALRAFGEYLLHEKLMIGDNPAKGILLPRLDAPVRKIVTDADCADLLAACERMVLAYPFRGRMARAVVGVLVYAGLRRAELLSLTLLDEPDTLAALPVLAEMRRLGIREVWDAAPRKTQRMICLALFERLQMAPIPPGRRMHLDCIVTLRPEWQPYVDPARLPRFNRRPPRKK